MGMAKSEYLKFVALTIFFVHSLNTDVVFHESTKNTVFEKPQFNLFTPSSCFTLYKTKFIKEHRIKFKEGISYIEDQTFII